MPAEPVSPEDFAAILNLMGRYQQLVDVGDEDGWAALFTEDGAFGGVVAPGADPIEFRGTEALKQVPRMNMATGGGRFRHNLLSFTADYGADRDEAVARYYMLGTMTPEGGQTVVAMQVDLLTHLVRRGGGWKIASNRMTKL